MITKDQQELFHKSIVAQSDDEDYSESGWVAVVVGDWAALAAYSHCSCYGTWTFLTEGCNSGINWDWQGSVYELIDMAKNKIDPLLPGRTVTLDDSDGDHLLEVYNQIIEWSDPEKSKGGDI